MKKYSVYIKLYTVKDFMHMRKRTVVCTLSTDYELLITSQGEVNTEIESETLEFFFFCNNLTLPGYPNGISLF